MNKNAFWAMIQNTVKYTKSTVTFKRVGINEVQINYNSYESSKFFFGPYAGWMGVFRMESRKNNSENVTRFMGCI